MSPYRAKSMLVSLMLSWLVFANLAHMDGVPKVLLVSFDGFRWDYLARGSLVGRVGNFTWVRSGVYAREGVKNAFLTKTFPNHMSIVTGMYEESHGIVGNVMFDPELNETFTPSGRQATESKWIDDGGEPIWVTNQMQGGQRRSGTVYWVGDGASIKGIRPYKYLVYDEKDLLPFPARVDKIIEWFTHPLYPINLGLLYFNEPDYTGHWYGPDSEQVDNMIAKLDGLVGYLLKRLKETELIGSVNLIITSDHGMTATPADKVINLDNYIDPTTYRIFESDPIGNILPNKGISVEDLYNNLTSVPHLKPFLKKDIPKQYHYTRNRRIQPLLLVTDEGYSLLHGGQNWTKKGKHGYNNSLSDMHPFFIARGPAFKTGESVDMFNNVDIYPLMCHILNLVPAANNGSLANVQKLLKSKETSLMTLFTYILILLMAATFAVMFSVAACRQQHFLKRQMLPFHASNIQYSVTLGKQSQTSLLSDSDEDNIP